MFKKGHNVRSSFNKVVKICDRCGEHGISAVNTRGICYYCSQEIYLNSKENEYGIYTITNKDGTISSL